ncbi:MAG: UDP-N-acetylmuramoyl-tripeptide--D-alanyl-D-alanine ligase [Phycisphaerales bacterium]|jgi:UDP-N-acetylmuramoyl-tripeptide--D-alanyl-D-alanine ligase
MGDFSVGHLARILGTKGTFPETPFNSVNTDSRTAANGQCFFALRGEKYDGHNYVTDALEKGALCAVVESGYHGPENIEHRLLKVADTKKALGNFAAQYRKKCDFKVVAITGSVGKTTTRRIAAHVLSRHFRIFTAPKNFNNEIGLPLTLLSADPADEIVIAELGTNHPGEIAYLSQIAKPDIALVTNVYPSHLEGFGNLETIAEEKLSIIQGLKDEGTLIINGDNKNLISTCRSKNIAFETFGTSPDCDVQALEVDCQASSIRFNIDSVRVTANICGRGNVENALAAWATCRKFDINAADFAEAIATTPAVASRLEIKRFGNVTVIDDCYNANPASMKNALDVLRQISSAQNAGAVFICGDMAELGAQSEQLHAELGDYIAKSNVRILIAVGPMASVAASTAKDAAEQDLQIYRFEDVDSACDSLHKIIKDYDIVLVKGSRSATLEKAVTKLRTIFLKVPINR